MPPGPLTTTSRTERTPSNRLLPIGSQNTDQSCTFNNVHCDYRLSDVLLGAPSIGNYRGFERRGLFNCFLSEFYRFIRCFGKSNIRKCNTKMCCHGLFYDAIELAPSKQPGEMVLVGTIPSRAHRLHKLSHRAPGELYLWSALLPL